MNNNCETLQYKKVFYEKISLGKPSKDKSSMYISKIFYLDKCVNIQTPSLNISKDYVSFKMVKKGEFFKLLEEIDEKLIQNIYLNSKLFFNGKNFTEKKIREAFKKSFKINTSGEVVMTTTVLNDGVKVYNNFKEFIQNPEFPLTGKCVLNLKDVVFHKNTITPRYIITHIKVDLVKKKIFDCVLEEDSEVENEAIKEVENEAIKEVENEANKEVEKMEQLEINTKLEEEQENYGYFFEE